MTDQDIIALDGYMQRCKLCPWRPRMAQNLAREMMSAPTQELRTEAAQELRAIRSKTRAELKKLSAIQEKWIVRTQVDGEVNRSNTQVAQAFSDHPWLGQELLHLLHEHDDPM
eukprot:g16803.t1